MYIGWAMDRHSQSLLGGREARDWNTDTELKVEKKSKKEMVSTIEKTFDETMKFVREYDATNLEEKLDYFGLRRTKSGLGEDSRAKLNGKPISYYLNLWEEVRRKTLEGLKARDDIWFAASIDEGMNNHWAWFHILKHSANHMGQIALVKSRLPR